MKKNFFYTATSIGSRLLTNLLLFIYLARIWGPSDFGKFSFVFGVFGLLVLLIDFGFQTYLMREIAAAPSHAASLIGDALITKLALLPLFLTCSLVALCVFESSLPFDLAPPIALCIIFSSFAEFFVAPLRALGRFDYETLVVSCCNILQFCMVLVVATWIGSPTSVAWSMAVARFIYLLLTVLILKHQVPRNFKCKFRISVAITTLRKTWAYGIDTMLSTAWTQSDIVIVSAIYGVQTLGLYAAGQKIVQGISLLAPVVGNVMIPRLAWLAHAHDPHLARSALNACLAMTAIGLFFGVPLLLFPLQISNLLFGENYSGLIKILPLFGVLIVARYMAASGGILITAVGLQRSRVSSQLIGISLFFGLACAIWHFGLSLDYFLISLSFSTVIVTLLNAKAWASYFRQNNGRS